MDDGLLRSGVHPGRQRGSRSCSNSGGVLAPDRIRTRGAIFVCSVCVRVRVMFNPSCVYVIRRSCVQLYVFPCVTTIQNGKDTAVESIP